MLNPNAIKLLAIMLALAIFAGDAVAQTGSIYHGILAEPNAKTQEVSTDDVRRILADVSAILIDPRKRAEYVAGHIRRREECRARAGRTAGCLCRRD
jgi:hypothetical protein